MHTVVNCVANCRLITHGLYPNARSPPVILRHLPHAQLQVNQDTGVSLRKASARTWNQPALPVHAGSASCSWQARVVGGLNTTHLVPALEVQRALVFAVVNCGAGWPQQGRRAGYKSAERLLFVQGSKECSCWQLPLRLRSCRFAKVHTGIACPLWGRPFPGLAPHRRPPQTAP